MKTERLPTPTLAERLVDWRGNEYGVGDTILYATAQSSNITMNEGVVEEIIEAEHPWRNEMTVKLKVRTLRSGSNYSVTDRQAPTKWDPNPRKQVTLTALGRVTKLED